MGMKSLRSGFGIAVCMALIGASAMAQQATPAAGPVPPAIRGEEDLCSPMPAQTAACFHRPSAATRAAATISSTQVSRPRASTNGC